MPWLFFSKKNSRTPVQNSTASRKVIILALYKNNGVVKEFFASVTSLANTFILAGKEENIPITPMKLQRLLYLVYKKYLKENGLPLFSTRFEAWKYGPVIRFLHDKLKHYKDNPIEELIEDGSGSVLVVKRNDSIKFMKEIWDNYKSYNGIELSDMICKKGFAWVKAVMDGTFILDDDNIRNEQDY